MAKKRYQSLADIHKGCLDNAISELKSTEEFNIMTYDIKTALNALLNLVGDVATLKLLMSDKYKSILREKFPNGDIEAIGWRDIKKFINKIDGHLCALEPALNSVKQIERLPSVGEIVKMIENNPNGTIINLGYANQFK